jgi:hypothetical protein
MSQKYREEESRIIVSIMDIIGKYTDDIEDLGEFERELVSNIDELESIKAVLYDKDFNPLTRMTPTEDGKQVVITDYPDFINSVKNSNSGWEETYFNGFRGRTYFHWVTLANSKDEIMILYSMGDNRLGDNNLLHMGIIGIMIIFLILIKTQFVDTLMANRILKQFQLHRHS